MAERTEFEEKEYENPLNNELLFDLKNGLWTPGQVFEKHFGIDAAIFAEDPRIWNLFGYKNIPDGVILNDYKWKEIWRKIKRKRDLPDFRLNLLVQSKRPIHRKGRNSGLAKFGIKGEYWKFEITVHQQEALEKLHRKLSKKVLICYACAAFHKLSDLFEHRKNRELVDNSTFVQAHRLKGHNHWIYNQPGSIGVAHSEPEGINDLNFRDILSSFSNLDQNFETNDLLELGNGAIEVISELEEKNPIKKEFNSRQDFIMNLLENDRSDRSTQNNMIAYLNFRIFCELTKVNWFIIGKRTTNKA